MNDSRWGVGDLKAELAHDKQTTLLPCQQFLMAQLDTHPAPLVQLEHRHHF